MINSWFIFALLSAVTLAGSELSQKVSLTQKVDISAITNNFYVWTMQGIGGIIISSFLFGFGATFPPINLLQLLLVSLAYFAGGTLFYSSYKGNSPSISIILGGISVVLSTFLGILAFGESTNPLKFIGIVTILLSIVILNFKAKERFSKSNLLALAGGLCFGVAYTLDKSFSVQIPPSIYIAIICFSVAFLSIISRPTQIISETRKMHPRNFVPMIFSAFFGTAFNFFTLSSYRLGGHVGVVDAINNTNVFMVILLEILLLRDRRNLAKKLICATLAFIGVFILSTTK